MGINLYDHQREALKHMKNGCILCGGVGSGKSRTAIAYYVIQQGGRLKPEYVIPDISKPLYIITTARKRDTFEWEQEIAPFRMSLEKPHNVWPNDIFIDSWNNIKKYKDVTDAFFIFDEQRVVGKGEWVKSFLKIAKSNDWILLSATPGDTWSDYIPVFIANGFFKNRTEFYNNHVIWKPRTNFPQIDHYVNQGVLIRMRNDILVDMPDERKTVLHDETMYVSYDISKYKAVVKDRWNPFDEKPIDNASEFCYILRRVINSDPERIESVKKLAEAKKKAIVFYSFDYERDILLEAFKPMISETFQITEWSGHRHEPIPKTENWVYLVQYTAGCEGWNCIETDTIIFYSQQYSYKVLTQAAGRINRMNTSFVDLYYYHLKSHAPIDLAISRALKNKQAFNERKFVNSL